MKCKRIHYNPERYLRGFSVGEKLIHLYKKVGTNVVEHRERSPKGMFWKQRLWSSELEANIKKSEDELSWVLDIEDHKSIKNNEKAERDILRLLCHYMNRNPYFWDKFEKTNAYKNLIEDRKKIVLDGSNKISNPVKKDEFLNSECCRTVLSGTILKDEKYSQALEAPELLMKCLSNDFKMCILSGQGKCFFTGDMPFCFYSPSHGFNYFKYPLVDSLTEIYFPLNKDACAVLIPRIGDEELERISNKDSGKDVVDDINRCIVFSSKAEFISPKKLSIKTLKTYGFTEIRECKD